MQKMVIKLKKKTEMNSREEELFFHLTLNLKDERKNMAGFTKEHYFRSPHEMFQICR